jgi:hypothetical protein
MSHRAERTSPWAARKRYFQLHPERRCWRQLFLGLAVSLALIAGSGRPAAAAPAAPAAAAPAGMQFVLSVPCQAAPCQPVVYGIGEITPNTAADFLVFLQTHPKARASTTGLILDSPGGSVMAALQFGTVLRQTGWNTLTGLSYYVQNKDTAAQLHTTGCYSACVWAFAGGVNRVMYTDGTLGLHQFFGVNSDASAQQMNAYINLYLDRMGVSRAVQDVASLTPAEQMRFLTMSEAAAFSLTYLPPPAPAKHSRKRHR